MPQRSLQELIQSLDDTTARQVLATFARAQATPTETALTPELRQALREFAPDPATTAVSASEGDLARAALLLLADDPQQQPILAALIEGSAPTKFGPVKNTAMHCRRAVRVATARQIRARQGRPLEHQDHKRADR